MLYTYYTKQISSNITDYETVYNLVNEAADDRQVTDSEWELIYETAKPVLCGKEN